jgi:hypothetical protein
MKVQSEGEVSFRGQKNKMLVCLILYSLNFADSHFETLRLEHILIIKCIHKFFGGIVLVELETILITSNFQRGNSSEEHKLKIFHRK